MVLIWPDIAYQKFLFLIDFQRANVCVGFSSILPKDCDKRTGEGLGDSYLHTGKILPTSPGSLANLLQSRPAGAMDVWRNRASNRRASPVYQPWGPWLLRGGGNVTSVPLIYHSAL